jgi:NAD(P)-dependent dehydrogenase (short-subunit alcohol dehydrogenase family)
MPTSPTTLIIGAALGLGLVIAEELLARGWTIMGMAIRGHEVPSVPPRLRRAFAN